MAVSATLNLPAQPALGGVEFMPLGGDGLVAPIGCYLADLQLAGDAGGGNATLTMNLDPRYTNLIAFINLTVSSAAAAPDFNLRIEAVDGGVGPNVLIVGTFPHITATSGPNAAFLWFPPPIYYIQNGNIRFVTVNVDVTEKYQLVAQIYCFHPEVTRRTPLPVLQMNVPGVSAPAAV